MMRITLLPFLIFALSCLNLTAKPKIGDTELEAVLKTGFVKGTL